MGKLEDLKYIGKFDKLHMLDILLDLPNQCKRASCIANTFKVPAGFKNFDKIFFTGLGGSAIGADIIKSHLEPQSNIPIEVNRNYTIPGFVNKKTLSFVCSYSGNTEETLSAYKLIRNKGTKIIIITSNGKLSRIACRDNVACITIPKGLPPRLAIGYMIIIPLVILSKLGLAKNVKADITRTTKLLEQLRDEKLNPNVTPTKNVSKQLAQALFRKYAIIYGSKDYIGSVVTRWRQDLNENSKILCSSHVFPEMNHNEITGWEDAKNISKDFTIIFLRDKAEHPRVQKRIEISKKLIGKKVKLIIDVTSVGKSLLERIFSLIYIGTFTSFYLAILNNVDPTPVNNVTYLKKQLGRT